MIEVGETTLKLALVAPNLTAVAPVKFVPVIVTGVPPAAGPSLAESFVIVGAAGVVNVASEPLLVPPAFIAEMRK